MPVICMFYGIFVMIQFEANLSHHSPHIHARFAEFAASIAIEDGRVLAGSLPSKQLKLVQAWMELHNEELLADWQLAVTGQRPFRIAPLQ